MRWVGRYLLVAFLTVAVIVYLLGSALRWDPRGCEVYDGGTRIMCGYKPTPR